MAQYRMCDEDREAFAGPEWVSFSLEEFVNEPVGVLDELERASGMSVGEIMHAIQRQSVAGMRALLWHARRKAGVSETWGAFTPRVLRIEARVEPAEGEDADPPAGGVE